MKIVFAGTPDFAVPTLARLLESEQVLAVYTQPDRPAGRGRKPRPSPVKATALEAGVEVRQPQSLRDADAQEQLAALAPDVMVVVAYGLILPPAVLAIPRMGCVNVHASLLPRWRGAAPIHRAVLAGDEHTGISIMLMEAGLDTGPVLATAETPILPTDSSGSLHDRLAALGAELLAQTLPRFAAGEIHPVPQDDARATYADKLRKEEAELNWRQPASALERQVRAFVPWPVAQTRWEGAPLRVWEACAEPGEAPPGVVIAADRTGIVVGTGAGLLRLTRLQAAGGKPLPAHEFLNGRRLSPGTRLGHD